MYPATVKVALVKKCNYLLKTLDHLRKTWSHLGKQQVKNTQRIAVFGGTFDPPHSGHLAVADAVLKYCDVDKVLFVVAGQPWQKMEANCGVSGISPAQDRLAMVEAAIAGRQDFEVSSIEIDREGHSYTADTLEELAKQYPGAELLLVIGSDLVSQLETWKRPEMIRRLSSLVIVERPGFENAQLPPVWSDSYLNYLKGELVNISSTQLRERKNSLGNNLGWSEDDRSGYCLSGDSLNVDFQSLSRQSLNFMPVSVAQAIAERGLYQNGDV